MEVDTETGRVTIRHYVCVDDVGNVVNPLIVEGQVHGGLAQGIAQALFEEAVYDEQGTLVTGTFVDYTPAVGAPTCRSFTTDRTETPATTQPAGRQGRRRGGHDRLDAGDRQRVRRRGAPPRRHRRRDAAARRSACGGRSRRRRGGATQETPVDTHSPGAGLGSIDPNNPQEEEVQ